MKPAAIDEASRHIELEVGLTATAGTKPGGQSTNSDQLSQAKVAGGAGAFIECALVRGAVQCKQAAQSIPCHQRRVAGATALEGQSQHQLGRCHGLRVAAGAARSPRCQKGVELTSSRFGATSTGLANPSWSRRGG